MFEMQSDVLALVVVDVDGDFLNQPKRLAIGRFEALQVGPENVVSLARRNALGELSHMIGVELPADFLRLIASLAYFHRDAVEGTVIGSPDSSGDQGVRFS